MTRVVLCLQLSFVYGLYSKLDTLLMMFLSIIVCVIKWINKQGNKGHHAKLYDAICLQID